MSEVLKGAHIMLNGQPIGVCKEFTPTDPELVARLNAINPKDVVDFIPGQCGPLEISFTRGEYSNKFFSIPSRDANKIYRAWMKKNHPDKRQRRKRKRKIKLIQRSYVTFLGPSKQDRKIQRIVDAGSARLRALREARKDESI
jgi:hypothetical protein